MNERPTPADVRGMFAGHDDYNVGIICGHGGLLALDCDDGPIFADTTARLAGLGVETWTVKSVRGGHVYLRCADTIAGRPGLDVRSDGQYVVAPESTHPSGVRYATIAGGPEQIARIDVCDMAALGLKPASSPAFHENDTPNFGAKTRPLSALGRRLLAGDPTTIAGYTSRSEAEYGLVLTMLNALWTFSMALAAFRSNPCAGKFAEKGRHAVGYLETTWENAVEWAASHPRPDLDALRAWAVSYTWPGRGGATSRVVFMAHLTVCERCGKREYSASVRELAQLSATTAMTVSRVNKRLISDGLIQLVSPGSVEWPAYYRLPAFVSIPVTLSIGVVGSVSGIDTENDSFRYEALGATGAAIVDAMRHGAETVLNIAGRSGRCRQTVYNKLTLMVEVGVVEPLGDGGYRLLDAPDWGQAAELLGTSGAGVRQKARHQQERAAHKRALERLDDGRRTV